jgi:hypothetical protein
MEKVPDSFLLVDDDDALYLSLEVQVELLQLEEGTQRSEEPAEAARASVK